MHAPHCTAPHRTNARMHAFSDDGALFGFRMTRWMIARGTPLLFFFSLKMEARRRRRRRRDTPHRRVRTTVRYGIYVYDTTDGVCDDDVVVGFGVFIGTKGASSAAVSKTTLRRGWSLRVTATTSTSCAAWDRCRRRRGFGRVERRR